MKNAKKIYYTVLPFVVVILLLAFLVINTYGLKGLYYRLLYHGDREIFEVSLTVDNEPVILNKNQINITCAECDSEISKDVSGNKLNFSFSAKEKNNYVINFNIGDYNFTIATTHFNWWEVHRYSISLKVDTKQNIIKYEKTINYMDDKGNSLKTIYTTDKDIKEVIEL